MANIYSYISRYGNKTFDDVEFNEVDAAILCNIPYVDFVGILDNSGDETTISVALEKFLMMKDFFPVRSEARKGCLLFPFLLKIVLEDVTRAISQEKERKDI